MHEKSSVLYPGLCCALHKYYKSLSQEERLPGFVIACIQKALLNVAASLPDSVLTQTQPYRPCQIPISIMYTETFLFAPSSSANATAIVLGT